MRVWKSESDHELRASLVRLSSAYGYCGYGERAAEKGTMLLERRVTDDEAWKGEDHYWKGRGQQVAHLELRSSEWLGNGQSDTSGLELRSGVNLDGSLVVVITLCTLPNAGKGTG